MVVKQYGRHTPSGARFESRVILDGSQTSKSTDVEPYVFESRVILDGSQTTVSTKILRTLFESRVILDGSQTDDWSEEYFTPV